MRVVWGVLLVLLAGVFVGCNAAIILLTLPDPVGLVLCITAAALPAVGFVFVVLRLDRFEHEPLALIGGAFFWGAAVATVFAYVINSAGGLVLAAVAGEALGDFLTASLVAPLVEESLKGAALLIMLLVFRREFDNVVDGIVYGAMIGLGFAMTENIIYFGRAYAESGVVGVGALFYLRVMLGGLAHAIYTGTIGAGIGYARERRSWWGWVIALVCFGLAIFQHFLWNTVPAGLIPLLVGDSGEAALLLFVVIFPVSVLLFLGPGFVLLLVLGFRSSGRESALIREQLRPELEAGVISPHIFDTCGRPFRRSLDEWGTLFSHGPGAWGRRRQTYQLATELAFSRHHAARGEFRDTAPQLEATYRQRLQALGAATA